MYGECSFVGVLILSTAVCITGFVGNVVSILVWTFGGICKNMYGAKFFLFVSIVDLYLIIAHPGLNFVDNVWHVDISVSTSFVCKYLNFSQYFFFEMSAFLTIVIATDCVLTSYFPLQYQTKRSVERAYASAMFLIVFLYLLNIHNIFKVDRWSFPEDVPLNSNTTLCVTNHGYSVTDDTNIGYLIFMINFLLMSVIPILMLTISGTIIGFKLLDRAFVNRCLRNQTYSQCKYAVAVSLTFVLTAIPWLFYRVTEFMGEMNYVYMYCMAYVTLCISVALKPWLYIALGREFRSDINDAMYRCCFRSVA